MNKHNSYNEENNDCFDNRQIVIKSNVKIIVKDNVEIIVKDDGKIVENGVYIYNGNGNGNGVYNDCFDNRKK